MTKWKETVEMIAQTRCVPECECRKLAISTLLECQTAKPKALVFDEKSRELKAAQFFFAQLTKEIPEHREPNWQAWAKDFDAMFRIDKYDPRQVAEVIRFARADDFWSKNILSPAALRRNYVKLLAKMRAPEPRPSNQPIARPVRHEENQTE